MSEGISFEDGVKWADYVIENSEKPGGMMMIWRNQAAMRRATYVMLNEIKKAYEELAKQNGDL